MSYKNLTVNNKNPKAFFQQYIRNIDEPKIKSLRDMSADLKPELLDDSYIMRRRFRLIAQRLRDHF